MMRASIARKTSIDSPFRGATDRPRLLGAPRRRARAGAERPDGRARRRATSRHRPLTGTAGDNGWFTSDVIVKWTCSGATTARRLPHAEHADAPTRPALRSPAPRREHTADEASRSTSRHRHRAPRPARRRTARRRNPRASPPDARPVLHRAAADQLVGDRRDLRHRRAALALDLRRHPTDRDRRTDRHLPRPRPGNVSAPLPFTFTYGTPRAAPPAADRPPLPATDADRHAHQRGRNRDGAAAAPPRRPRQAKRPTLTWRARPKVKYYNLQLFRNGRKILSAWPTVAHYTLEPSWRYHGQTYKLTAGRYRWYVWPGYGPRAAHRYGRLLAKGAVTVPTS